MVQASEVVDLVIAVVLFPIIATAIASFSARSRAFLLVIYAAMVCGYVFTIAEGFFLADVMNLLEHASYAVAGVLALVAVVDYERHRPSRGVR